MVGSGSGIKHLESATQIYPTVLTLADLRSGLGWLGGASSSSELVEGNWADRGVNSDIHN
jgi:hypothetical protein